MSQLTESLKRPSPPTWPSRAVAKPRRIVEITRGSPHGSIRRMLSPNDLGQILKPFVFLDYVKVKAGDFPRFGLHPHSGIATLTFTLQGQGFYEETTGKKGILEPGDIEWMVAGGGVWHTGGGAGTGDVEGFQLWVALPPDLENGPSFSQHIRATDVPRIGPARVLLGRYGSESNPAIAPFAVNYLAVLLQDGERWSYEPPAGHEVAWVMVHAGQLNVGRPIAQGELAVFSESTAPIDFSATGLTAFILGSAVPHPHELAIGYHSVHTNPMALAQGEAGILALGRQLQRV